MLRALPDFPADLPAFDIEDAPEDPTELFFTWLDDALAAGVLQPHAFSLATVSPEGMPSSRMLILKNIEGSEWHFATSRESRKGVDLATNPGVAANFYWPELGRQIRVVGTVTLLSTAESVADWNARPGTDGTPNPAWQVYAIHPTEIEFWQASHDRRHIRHRYVLPADVAGG